jgi:ketosteroid isomerase-like protein
MKGIEQAKRDLETLEALYARWARGDFANTDAFTEDVVWVPTGAPESGVFTGIEELTKSWRGFLQAWEELRISAKEVIPGSGGKYVVMQVFRGKGKSSGVETEGKTAVFFTMRDGKVARMEGYWDRDAALRAAGIDKGPR